MLKDLLEELDPAIRRDILLDIYDENDQVYKGKYSKIPKKLLKRKVDVWAPYTDVVKEDYSKIVIEKSVWIRVI